MKPPITKRKDLPTAAFSLLELLVLIAILGILAGLLLPPMYGGGPSIRIKCLSNLKQFNLGVLNYAMDNQNRLPQMASWNQAWDLPWSVSATLLRNGLTRDNMCDPANPDQNVDALWNFAPNNYRVIGYAMTFPGTASVTVTNQNPKINPDANSFVDVILPVPDPSHRVLAAGVVISLPGQNQTDAASRAPYNYTSIPGAVPKPHRSSHLNSTGKYPLGDNVAMMDGSGRWQMFTNMIPRTTPGTGPTFWW